MQIPTHLCIDLYYLYSMYCIIILLNVLIGKKPGDKENATTAVNHIWIATLHSGLYWTAIVHRNLSSKQSSLWPSHRASRPTTWDLNNAQLSFGCKGSWLTSARSPQRSGRRERWGRRQRRCRRGWGEGHWGWRWWPPRGVWWSQLQARYVQWQSGDDGKVFFW